ncbi:centromere protein V-like [Lytechinus variegatus]|uniref:centromere protein V-like n=1 Tax=Lytechinus variegatus TaxID=7654 RepID=UPI001BB25825|nr:centromere protein V-like [Lytechinus variegatus]XP_041456894.1 centromere protein V-like [Lytechinus variegatus]XP_041456895.1 centromere protein V-like [Lytechinus variegatus]
MATETKEETPLIKHTGGCHCGLVRFEAMAPAVITVMDCDCSICVKKQNRHFIVPNSKFKLLQGEDMLTCYTFNTHQAKHTFCKVCGVQSFYTPRSSPDCKGIAPHCIDPGTIQGEIVERFHGVNWEETFTAKGGYETFNKQ